MTRAASSRFSTPFSSSSLGSMVTAFVYKTFLILATGLMKAESDEEAKGILSQIQKTQHNLVPLVSPPPLPPLLPLPPLPPCLPYPPYPPLFPLNLSVINIALKIL